MEVVHERCCGLDVHKKKIVACLLTPGRGGQAIRDVRTFDTTTKTLLALLDWLSEERCTHVAMESTGSYWKPVYNILEDAFKLLVVNAQHLKAVPGRKTDVRDAEWIADLLRHGLLAPSFIPSRPERELRELTRYRTSLVRERASEVNRLQKVLEGANIKLASVAADVVGVSGRAMLAALVSGTQDTRSIVELARGKLRNKRDALQDALEGRVGAHQRFLIRTQLRHIDELKALIDDVSEEIEQRLQPMREDMERLMTIPGIGRRVAETFLSEIGNDMTHFPSARHLASWAGLCPGNNESAGKSRTGRTRRGSPWLRSVLVEAAVTAGHTKTYLGAQFRRLAARRGAKRAAVALAHTIIIIAYHLLSRGQDYSDLGTNYFDQRDRDRVRYRLTNRPSTPLSSTAPWPSPKASGHCAIV
jgi:transposase